MPAQEPHDVEVTKGPPPTTLEALAERLRAYLSGTEVDRAIVFGSYARGDADLASDLDLVLIERTEQPFVERGRAHLPLFRLGLGVDLLVYTPEEYARMKAAGNPLIQRIEEEGVEVYARREG